MRTVRDLTRGKGYGEISDPIYLVAVNSGRSKHGAVHVFHRQRRGGAKYDVSCGPIVAQKKSRVMETKCQTPIAANLSVLRKGMGAVYDDLKWDAERFGS